MEVLQGWHPDLFGSHEFRWFSDGKPTSRVRDDGVEGFEEVVEPPPLSGVQTELPPPEAGTAIAIPPPSKRSGAVKWGIAVGVVMVLLVAGIASALIGNSHHKDSHPTASVSPSTSGNRRSRNVPRSTTTQQATSPTTTVAPFAPPTTSTLAPQPPPPATPITSPPTTTLACPAGSPQATVSLSESSDYVSMTGTATNEANGQVEFFAATAQVLDASGNIVLSDPLTVGGYGGDGTLNPGQSVAISIGAPVFITSSGPLHLGSIAVSWTWPASSPYTSCPSGLGQ